MLHSSSLLSMSQKLRDDSLAEWWPEHRVHGVKKFCEFTKAGNQPSYATDIVPATLLYFSLVYINDSFYNGWGGSVAFLHPPIVPPESRQSASDDSLHAGVGRVVG